MSTVLSSSLEFIPRSFKPKGGGGTTVKIVLKEKHKKGKGWKGQAICRWPKVTSPGLWILHGICFSSSFPPPSPTSHSSTASLTQLSQLWWPTAPWLHEPITFQKGLEGDWSLECFGDLGLHVVLPGQCHRGTGCSSLHLPTTCWVCSTAVVLPSGGEGRKVR